MKKRTGVLNRNYDWILTTKSNNFFTWAFKLIKKSPTCNPDYGNCRNLIYFGADMLSWLLPFTVLPRALHFILEVVATFFFGKIWNSSTCPPLNQSSKALSYAFARITLTSWWVWPHQGHLDAFASFRRLFSCAVHICASSFSVLNQMHGRPIKNYQRENLKQSFLEDVYRSSRSRRLSFPNPLKHNDDIFLKK